MRSELTRRALVANRISLTGWSIGIVGATAMYASSYGFVDPATYEDTLDSIPADLRDAFDLNAMSSGAGYLASTVFGLILPILVITMAIGLAARLIAGDEESGQLELTIAHPVARHTLILQRALALLATCAMAAGLVFATLAALNRPIGLDVPLARIAGAATQLGLLAAASAMVTFAIGAATGRRGLAVGIGATAAVLAYAANTILPTVNQLEWISSLSMFRWYDANAALTGQAPIAGGLILATTIAALTAASVAGFNTRDIGA